MDRILGEGCAAAFSFCFCGGGRELLTFFRQAAFDGGSDFFHQAIAASEILRLDWLDEKLLSLCPA